MKKPQSVIWNITRLCAWDCDFCLIDAYHAQNIGNDLIIRTNGLKTTYTFERNVQISLYEEAGNFLKCKVMELSLEDKLKILDNIDIKVKLDFSGGDPFLLNDNIEVIRRASEKFGKTNIEATSTGTGIGLVDIRELSEILGGFDFTYDYPSTINVPNRPNGYNRANLKKAKDLKRLGMKITAQTPLSKENISRKCITEIYKNLHEAGIDELLIMKIFRIGRGAIIGIQSPSKEEYSVAVKIYKEMEQKFGTPKLRIQSYLRKIVEEKGSRNPSNLISKALNITNIGKLLISPWAYNAVGEPLEQYMLGDLIIHKLSKLYNPDIRTEYMERLENEN